MGDDLTLNLANSLTYKDGYVYAGDLDLAADSICIKANPISEINAWSWQDLGVEPSPVPIFETNNEIKKYKIKHR